MPVRPPVFRGKHRCHIARRCPALVVRQQRNPQAPGQHIRDRNRLFVPDREQCLSAARLHRRVIRREWFAHRGIAIDQRLDCAEVSPVPGHQHRPDRACPSCLDTGKRTLTPRRVLHTRHRPRKAGQRTLARHCRTRRLRPHQTRGHQVDNTLGHVPERRQLATSDRDDPRFGFPHPILPREGPRGAVVAGLGRNQWSQPGLRRQDVRRLQRDRRERTASGLKEVLHLGSLGFWRSQVTVIRRVGRSQHCNAKPRDNEEEAPVAGRRRVDSRIGRKAVQWHEEVDPLGWTDAGLAGSRAH